MSHDCCPKITMLPGVRGGRPCIDGVPVEIMLGRFIAGETFADLVYDYGICLCSIETALRHAVRVEKGLEPKDLALRSDPA